MSVWLSAGCIGTQFRAYVRDVKRRPITGVDVLLFSPEVEPCRGSPSAGGRTNADGYATITARWCGRSKIVAAGRGYKPKYIVVDTCAPDAVPWKSGDLFLELERRVAPAEVFSDDMIATAGRFLEAVRHRTASEIEALLLEPSDLTLFEGSSSLRSGSDCQPRFVRTLGDDESSVVEYAIDCDDGCTALWHVHLSRRNARWRIRGLTPETGPRLMR